MIKRLILAILSTFGIIFLSFLFGKLLPGCEGCDKLMLWIGGLLMMLVFGFGLLFLSVTLGLALNWIITGKVYSYSPFHSYTHIWNKIKPTKKEPIEKEVYRYGKRKFDPCLLTLCRQCSTRGFCIKDPPLQKCKKCIEPSCEDCDGIDVTGKRY